MTEPHPQGNGKETTTKLPVETEDGGMFDFLGMKEEDNSQEDAVMIDKADVPKPIEKKKPKLMDALHRSHSNSSSSSDEEDEGGEKNKNKKKGLKEKIKEKISCEKKEEVSEHKDSSLPPEKCNETGNAEATQAGEKKGFLDKIKEKLPGQNKRAEDGIPAAQHECTADETREKKGILEKIKDKLPGCHKNDEDE